MQPDEPFAPARRWHCRRGRSASGSGPESGDPSRHTSAAAGLVISHHDGRIRPHECAGGGSPQPRCCHALYVFHRGAQAPTPNGLALSRRPPVAQHLLRQSADEGESNAKAKIACGYGTARPGAYAVQSNAFRLGLPAVRVRAYRRTNRVRKHRNRTGCGPRLGDRRTVGRQWTATEFSLRPAVGVLSYGSLSLVAAGFQVRHYASLEV
jgi:hypothetical protein